MDGLFLLNQNVNNAKLLKKNEIDLMDHDLFADLLNDLNEGSKTALQKRPQHLC
jgi:hypothetical protein